MASQSKRYTLNPAKFPVSYLKCTSLNQSVKVLSEEPWYYEDSIQEAIYVLILC